MATDNDAIRLLERLVFPGEFSATRYNDGAAATPSAAVVLSQEININWATATVDRSIPATEAMVLLFRDPVRAVVFYDHNVARTVFRYDLINSDANTTAFSGVINTEVSFEPVFANATTTYQPHGNRLYPIDAGDHYGLWCDYDGTNYNYLSVVLADATAVTGGVVNWWFWNGAKWGLWDTMPLVNGTATYSGGYAPPDGGGYMRVSLALPIGSTNQTVLVSLVCHGGVGPSVWCHRAVSNMDQLMPIIKNIRVNAAAIQWLNLSPELDESGKIVSVVVPTGDPWNNVAISQSSLTLLEGYKTRQAKVGFYGFTKPSGRSDSFDYKRQFARVAVRGSADMARVAAFADYNTPYLIASMSVAITSARDTSVTVTHTIEYLTDSKIQETRLADASADTWKRALNVLGQLNQHHDANITFKDVLENNSAKRVRKE
jgi:hypothetical protein